MAGRQRDWSTLPDPIIQTIAELLEASTDILRLRAVCNSFRSAIPPPILFSPHLKDLYFNFLPPAPSLEPERLAIKLYTVYLVQPISEIPPSTSTAKHGTTKARLIKVRESGSCKVRLLDPFTSVHYKHLNHMLPKCLSLYDCRVTEIAKEYGLEYADDCERFLCLPRKVAVSTDHGDELVLMTLVDTDLHMWRSGNKKWVHVSCYRPRYFVDVIYHKRKFYALLANSRLISIDLETLNKYNVVMPQAHARIRGCKSFVKSGEDLFMVCEAEDACGRCDINIFKFDEEERVWEEVKDGLGDKALFMFEGGNVLVSAKEFDVFKRNCVYLPGKVRNDFWRGRNDFDNGYPGRGARIFSFEHGTTAFLTAFPGYSEIFWPPPTLTIPKCEDYEYCLYKNLIS